MVEADVPEEALREPEVRSGRPRDVILVPTYVDRIGLLKPGLEAYQADLLFLIQLLKNGTPIPRRFYRSVQGPSTDQALEEYGVMHLHLLNPSTDVLVFLMQFEDWVAILEVNNHLPFQQRPPAHLLRLHHWQGVLEARANRLAAIAKSKADKRADIRRRLFMSKKPTP
ncbi:hypothetical protein [Roseomonas chloroacetimidivorans]|uniref:hypothetical protein n=1 Tax=Roseomonas chloroacetimidivorans TaxID=1766656 RepID=UPI003C71E88A